MTHSSEVLLRHILLCLDRIAEYTGDGRAQFFVDMKTQDAVIRNLGIIERLTPDSAGGGTDTAGAKQAR